MKENFKYDKKWISWFNKNKTKELYKEVLIDNNIKYNKCRCCDDVIYYYDSTFQTNKNKNNEIKLFHKSFISTKTLFNKDYYLSVCEDCLVKKYPEYINMNKGRVFNSMNKITCYAFNISEDLSKKWRKENTALTLENFIKKYGEKDGNLRWKSYCDKQAYSNSFEYKQEKHNWSKEQYDDFNKSRAVTIDNLINKHGLEEGTKIWDNYVKTQIITKSKDYVVEKYGEEYWINLTKSKRLNLENFIRKYDKEIGLEKYNNYLDKIKCYKASKISQTYFDKLDKYFSNYKTYYYNKSGKEYGKMLSNGRYVLLDYFILELNLAIEYNGDLWHANPSIFKENDIPYGFFDDKLTAKNIWKKEEERLELLKKDHDIDTIVIWESNEIDCEELYKKIKEKYKI